MKVSEAINQLKIGDTVWVKGKVELMDKQGFLPLCANFVEATKYFSKNDEISLTEPVSKKVKIPFYVGVWINYCKNKEHSLHTAMNEWCISSGSPFIQEHKRTRDWLTDENYQEHEEIFARAWLDGFVIENPKKYKVKVPYVSYPCHYYLRLDGETIGISTGKPYLWTKEQVEKYFKNAEVEEVTE